MTTGFLLFSGTELKAACTVVKLPFLLRYSDRSLARNNERETKPMTVNKPIFVFLIVCFYLMATQIVLPVFVDTILFRVQRLHSHSRKCCQWYNLSLPCSVNCFAHKTRFSVTAPGPLFLYSV